jgi:GNAT superfamily N-acetyltransferase
VSRDEKPRDPADVFVAVADGRAVGFVAFALDAFHERMGWIEIIGVDPDYQRRGIGSRLTELAMDQMRSRGMTSPSWRQEAIPATPRREPHTKRRASFPSRSRGISGSSADAFSEVAAALRSRRCCSERL